MVNKNYYYLALVGASLLHVILGFLLLYHPEFKQRITLSSAASTAKVISAFTITAQELSTLSKHENSSYKTAEKSVTLKQPAASPSKISLTTTNTASNSSIFLKQLQQQTLEARQAELKSVAHTLAQQKRLKKRSSLVPPAAQAEQSISAHQTLIAGNREFKLAGGTMTNSGDQAILTLGRAIAAHWVKPHNLTSKDFITVNLKVAIDGTVTATKVIASSKHAALEHSALTALASASPLPITGIPYQNVAQLTVTFRDTGVS